jgi:hypothetical protein
MKKFIVITVLINILSSATANVEGDLSLIIEEFENRETAIKQQAHKRGSIILIVGAAGNCQFNTIQAAISAATSTTQGYEIRIANDKVYTESVNINKLDMTLKGGYATCTDANSDTGDGSQAEINATVTGLPAFIITNSNISVKHTNNLYNLNILNGTGNGANSAGGINVMDNNIEVYIENTFISNNEGINGGGVYIEGSTSMITLNDSYILVNDSVKGAGLYCDAADVFIYGDSGIVVNEATQGGGGVYLTNACQFNIFSGTSGGTLDFRGIAGNTAQQGGGIYANLGAQVGLWGYQITNEIGSSDQPVNITSNKARINGGGLYIHGAETEVNAYATIINNNEVESTLPDASTISGGIYVQFGTFSLGKLNLDCWDAQKCNQISDNKVFGPDSRGAGIVGFSGARIKIKDTWISDHHAAQSVFMYGQETNTQFEGNVFTNNGGDSIEGNNFLLDFNDDSGSISVAYNTFVDNEINQSLFQISQNPFFIVFGNIIKEDNNVDILGIALGGGSSSNTQVQCLIAHENQSFTGTQVLVADPLFVDQANEDFHLSSSSPAIDYCSDTFMVSTKDLDEQDRGWDDTLTDDMFGIYDAGVDEFYPATTADLSVIKNLLTPAPYVVSEDIQYQITVTNNGPDNASNVNIEDTATGMELLTIQSANCSSFPCLIANLNNGESEVISVTAKLRDTVGNFDNTVSVASEDYDPNTNDNIDNTGNGGVAVLDHVDLVTQVQFITQAPYHNGQTITIQASVTNNGPDSAKNVDIIEFGTLNTQVLNITSAECPGLPCNIITFPSGMTIDMTLTVQISSGGSFNFGLKASTNSNDDDGSNDFVIVGGVAGNSADVSVVANLLTLPDYYSNSNVEFEITFTNNGPDSTQASTVNILNNLQVTSVTGEGCSSLNCTLGIMNNGDVKTINVIASIIQQGSFSLASTINSSAFDSNSNNNNNSASATALGSADVSTAVDILTQGDYFMGQQIVVEVSVTNNGPDTSDTINLTTSGNGITIDMVTGSGCNMAVCSLTGLDNGSSVVITVLATITDNNSFIIGATATSDTFDVNLNNNESSLTNNVVARPELIFKSSFE